MATTPSLTPDQEQLQPQESVPNPVSVSATTSAWHSSGSIGPFFAVISVLTVLAVISCFAGRICKGRSVTPPENIQHGGGCLGWLRRKWCACANNDAEVLGNTAAESNDVRLLIVDKDDFRRFWCSRFLGLC
ncbi:uncharacterized protein [Coffea arabica]|uniref:Uncharacterized protein isoform X2 n=1 Tax=Coffea arabica TaxID=13443 RepID=A0ABM4U3K8_COFAR